MKTEEALRPKLENTDNSGFPSGNFPQIPTTFSPYLKYNILLTYTVMFDVHQWGQNHAESKMVHLSF